MPSDAYSDYSESGEDSPYNTVNIYIYIICINISCRQNNQLYLLEGMVGGLYLLNLKSQTQIKYVTV